MTYYVYIIECTDNSFYTGITGNVRRRMKEHKSGTASRYTKNHGFKKLMYLEEQPNRSAARMREMKIKRRGKDYKKKLIEVQKGDLIWLYGQRNTDQKH